VATKEQETPVEPMTDEQRVAEEQRRQAEDLAQAEKEGKVTNEDGTRDISAEQETATRSAQDLVQERHMNPEAFGADA
jgi:hypothetical protein